MIENRLLRLISFFLMFSVLSSAQAVVYVVAHPDDLQLMMAGNAIVDIQGNYPTVIVILSAGDAGNLNQPWKVDKLVNVHDYNKVGYKYYRVRNDAHEASIKAWIPSSYSQTVTHSTEYFSGSIPSVEKSVIGNVVTYYLNLPDSQLPTLYGGGGNLQDVEGINTYTKSSLQQTIRTIISENSRGITALAVNFQEPDPSYAESGYNQPITAPELQVFTPTTPTTFDPDHGDHTAAGKFVRDALQEDSNFLCVGQVAYMGYPSRWYPDGLSTTLTNIQKVGFNALNNILIIEGNQTFNSDSAFPPPPPAPPPPIEHLGSSDGFHTKFFGKQKFRFPYVSGGGGACSF